MMYNRPDTTIKQLQTVRTAAAVQTGAAACFQLRTDQSLAAWLSSSSRSKNGCPGSVRLKKLSRLMYTCTFPSCISAVSCDSQEEKSTSSVHQVTVITTVHSRDCFCRSNCTCFTHLLDPHWQIFRHECQRTAHAVQLQDGTAYFKNSL